MICEIHKGNVSKLYGHWATSAATLYHSTLLKHNFKIYFVGSFRVQNLVKIKVFIIKSTIRINEVGFKMVAIKHTEKIPFQKLTLCKV